MQHRTHIMSFHVRLGKARDMRGRPADSTEKAFHSGIESKQ